MALPPQALASTVKIGIVRVPLLLMAGSSCVRCGGLDFFPAGLSITNPILRGRQRAASFTRLLGSSIYELIRNTNHCHTRVLTGCPCASPGTRSEEHTSELQSQSNLVCRLLLEKKKKSNRSE